MVILIRMANSYLLWEVDKDNIANQSAISLIIRKIQLVYVGIRWYVKGWRETEE